ncbi:hypothetical protein NL676_016892 [Syzygium grande]|nr:hypothetical protein NL676_016892 [Syzygium grande]
MGQRWRGDTYHRFALHESSRVSISDEEQEEIPEKFSLLLLLRPSLWPRDLSLSLLPPPPPPSAVARPPSCDRRLISRALATAFPSMVLKRRARVITYGGGVNPKHLRVSRCSSSYGVDLEGRLDAIERRLDQIEDELQATRQENAALRRRMDERSTSGLQVLKTLEEQYSNAVDHLTGMCGTARQNGNRGE